MKIIINPLVNVYYSSFYIKGLIDLYGKKSIVFDAKPFSEIRNMDANFNFILEEKGLQKKVSVHWNDTYEINQDCYKWCDVYGCVNTNWKLTPNDYKEKLVCLAPSFGIRLWNKYETLFYAVSNYLKSAQKGSFKKSLGKYKRQYLLRLPIHAYFPSQVDENYVFHVSTLWQSDEWVKNDEFVNRIRAIFIETCKSIETIHFEGGFYYSGNHPLNENFKHLIVKDFIPVKEYIKKVQQSILVFNTPAWLNCNGWKLGEYLAMGKAIISTHLYNDLPEPLVHGENIHFVSDDSKEIKEAILFICNNKGYREKISKGAYAYYLRNATPVKSLELLGITKK